MIALTRGAALDQEEENDDHRNFMASTQKRMQKMEKHQPNQMPKLISAAKYVGPVVITHAVEKTGNNCVITNETHSKMTNNGFTRGELGRFFMH